MSYDERPWVKFYPEWVNPNPAIPETTYLDCLTESFAKNGDRPAMHFMGRTISFRELDELSARFAHFLAENGYGSGDAVSIITPNIPQNQIVNVGVCRAGCVAQGISVLLAPKEMAYQLNHSGAKAALIWDVMFEQKFMKIQDQVPNLKHVAVCNLGEFLPGAKRFLGNLLKKLPSGKIAPVAGKTVLTLPEVLKKHPPQAPKVSVKPEDTCLIQYTGGTTGVPKGAEVSHRNIMACMVQMVNWLDLKERGDIMCSGFPFFHIAGLFIGMINLHLGNPQILLPDPRNAAHIANEYKKYRPTVVANVPPVYQMLIDHPAFRSLDHSKSRYFISAASPLPEKLYHDLEAVVGRGKVLELFGMTETMVTSLDPPRQKKKIGSVGLPWPAYRLKIVDLETGTKEVPLGQEGELIVRGPGVMKGYWNMPEETARTLKEFEGEKWLFTGDVLRMDQEGYMYVVDRCKDMIDVRGNNVFSREVEDKLYEHAAVELCAVVGMPDPKRPGTQLVRAVIQPTPEYKDKDKKELEKDILEHCRENMAHYKVPRVIEFTEAMPLTSVGKVDKKVLR